MKRIVLLILPIMLLLLAGCGSKQSLLTNGEATKHTVITYNARAESGSIVVFKQEISGSSYTGSTEQDSDGQLTIPDLTKAIEKLSGVNSATDIADTVSKVVDDKVPAVEDGDDGGVGASGKPQAGSDDVILPAGKTMKIPLTHKRTRISTNAGRFEDGRAIYHAWTTDFNKYIQPGYLATFVVGNKMIFQNLKIVYRSDVSEPSNGYPKGYAEPGKSQAESNVIKIHKPKGSDAARGITVLTFKGAYEADKAFLYVRHPKE